MHVTYKQQATTLTNQSVPGKLYCRGMSSLGQAPKTHRDPVPGWRHGSIFAKNSLIGQTNRHQQNHA